MNSLLSAIIGEQDRELVDLTDLTKPEWKLERKLYYRVLGGDEREKVEIKLRGGSEKSQGLYALLLGLGLSDEHGDLICKNGDARALMAKNGVVLNRLAEEALHLNGFGSKADNDTAKNLESDQSDDFGSG